MTTTDEPQPEDEQPAEPTPTQGRGEPLPPAASRPMGQEGLPPDTPIEPEEEEPEKKGLLSKIADAVTGGDNPPDDSAPGGAEAMKNL